MKISLMPRWKGPMGACGYAASVCLAAILAALGFETSAKTFQNSYVAFDVPDDWSCLQEGVAWTCTAMDPHLSKEAVIVMAAKVAGPEDSVDSFLSYLSKPKSIPTKLGTPMPSQVIYAKKEMLGGQNWVQAQHLGSEIQEYYTLYLATVKDKLALLISFSAEQNHFKNYNPIFNNAIRSLRIVANQELLFQKDKQKVPSGLIGIEVPQGGARHENLMPPSPLIAKGNGSTIVLLGIVATLVAGIAFLLTSRQRQRQKKRKNRQGKPS